MPSKDSSQLVTVDQLNRLVLDFLVVNGYSEVAQKFSIESGMPSIDFDDIAKRRQFRNLMLAGDIQGAIEQLNALDPWYLDMQPDHHFELLQIQLIELIRKANIDEDISSIEPALNFAETRILSMIEQQKPDKEKEFLDYFQKVMTLVCFPLEDLPPHLQELMSIERRAAVADRINEAFLIWKGTEGTAKLKKILKFSVWAQNELSERNISYPTLDL